jgi:hypothetical protein
VRVGAVVCAVALCVGGLTADSPAVGARVGFRPPVRVNNAATVVFSTHAAVDLDSAGNAVAVWDSDGTIYGARRPRGGHWSAPTPLMPTYFGGPDVVALGEDGSAYFDYGTEAPDGDAIAQWASDGSVDGTGVGSQYAAGRAEADVDGDVVAYVETANGVTTYHFASGGTDPVSDGWTSATTLESFGSSQVTFGAGHTYLVAYPPDSSGDDRRFRVTRVDGDSGQRTLLARRRLCEPPGRLAGYDIAAGRRGASVLAWRCTSRTVDSVNIQRIRPGGRLGSVVEIARSRQAHVVDRLSPPTAAFGPRGPTVVFSRADTPRRRDVVAVSRASTGKWRHTAIARGLRSHSAAALAVRLDWSASGAALLTYRRGGFHGAIWAVRRLPGAPFGKPTRVFSSARARSGAVAVDGAAIVARVAADGRLLARFAAG